MPSSVNGIRPSKALIRFLKAQSTVPTTIRWTCFSTATTTTRPSKSSPSITSRQTLNRHSVPQIASYRSNHNPKRKFPDLRNQEEDPDQDHDAKIGQKPESSWHTRLWSIRNFSFDRRPSSSSSSPGGKYPGSRLTPEEEVEQERVLRQASMLNNRRLLEAKAAFEPRLRCTELDENGDVIMTDSEFKKTELIAKYGLLPRDLRKIDSSNLPHILIRPSSILLNLLHLRVLIKHDRVLLFDMYGSTTSHSQSAFMYDLQHKIRQKGSSMWLPSFASTSSSSSSSSSSDVSADGHQTPPTGGVNSNNSGVLPYEFRALEAVLTSVTTELEAEFESVREPIIEVLSDLEDDVDRNKLRVLLILSKKVTTFEQKAKLVRDVLEELLEVDDDLSSLYLTEKANGLYRSEDDHTEIEMLLESYHKLCDEIVQEAGNLVSSIRNTEEIIGAILDANRNALMVLDLKFSVGTISLAMGTFLVGLYGMNLENFIEETSWGFVTVTSLSSIISLLLGAYGMRKLGRLQRVKMMVSDESVSSRQSWLKEDGLLDARSREKLHRINMQKALSSRQQKWHSWRRFWH